MPVATFAKFQPHSVDFLDLTNPKAVLESRLRNFACLSTGDVIAIMYNDRVYEMSVLETKPTDAVSVIECDLNVDFAPPVGYREPERTPSTAAGQGGEHDEAEQMDMSELMPEPSGFIPFKGSGNRLDGKKKRTSSKSEAPKVRAEYVRGIPDYDFEIRVLKFIRNPKPKVTNGEADDSNNWFEAFKGEGQSLRQAKGK